LESIPFIPEVYGDLVDAGAVAEGERAAEGVGGQLVHHGATELVLAVGQEKTFQAIYAVQFLIVEQEAGCIDGDMVNLPTASKFSKAMPHGSILA
jgi:hypothetical protein